MQARPRAPPATRAARGTPPPCASRKRGEAGGYCGSTWAARAPSPQAAASARAPRQRCRNCIPVLLRPLIPSLRACWRKSGAAATHHATPRPRRAPRCTPPPRLRGPRRGEPYRRALWPLLLSSWAGRRHCTWRAVAAPQSVVPCALPACAARPVRSAAGVWRVTARHTARDGCCCTAHATVCTNSRPMACSSSDLTVGASTS